MIHQRQRLPFGLEPGDDGLRVHAQFDDLQGDPAPDRFGLFGHVHHPAAAFADLLEELVAAHLVTGLLGGWGGGEGGRVGLEEVPHRLVRLEQGTDLRLHPSVALAGVAQEDIALDAGGPGLGSVEQLDQSVGIGSHQIVEGAGPFVTSCDVPVEIPSPGPFLP